MSLLRDRRFHNALSLLRQMNGLEPDDGPGPRRQSILAMEGEDHARLRRLVAPAFTPAAADRLRPVHARGRGRPGRRASPRPAAASSSPTCASPTRSRSSASCSAPRRRTGGSSRRGPPTSSGSSTRTWPRTCPLVEAADAELEAYLADLIAGAAHDARRRPAERPHRHRGGRRPALHRGAGLPGRGRAHGRHRHHPQPAGLRPRPLRRAPRTSGRCWPSGPSSPPGPSRRPCATSAPSGARSASTPEDVVFRDVLFPKGTLVSVSLAGANRDPGHLRRARHVRHHP